MQPFTNHTGLVAPMDRANVDTDQIIPKQFLKRIERTGFGQFLFFDWRFLRRRLAESRVRAEPAGVCTGASVLLARRNFGCGSSREHAPWALEDYGFRVVIAPSFADIFYNNCFKNGMLPIRLDEADGRRSVSPRGRSRGYRADRRSGERARSPTTSGLSLPFEVEPFRRHCLLNGLDDIGLTLRARRQDRGLRSGPRPGAAQAHDSPPHGEFAPMNAAHAPREDRSHAGRRSGGPVSCATAWRWSWRKRASTSGAWPSSRA